MNGKITNCPTCEEAARALVAASDLNIGPFLGSVRGGIRHLRARSQDPVLCQATPALPEGFGTLIDAIPRSRRGRPSSNPRGPYSD